MYKNGLEGYQTHNVVYLYGEQHCGGLSQAGGPILFYFLKITTKEKVGKQKWQNVKSFCSGW